MKKIQNIKSVSNKNKTMLNISNSQNNKLNNNSNQNMTKWNKKNKSDNLLLPKVKYVISLNHLSKLTLTY